MRPPECDVCDERFDPDVGALVRFFPRPSDTEWRERSEREGFVGHPPDTGWFCGRHMDAARTLTELTLPDAMSLITSGLAVTEIVRHFDDQEPWIGLACPKTETTVLARVLCDFVPRFATALGFPDLGPLERHTSRSWSPMDRETPPNSPYVDETRWTAAHGEYSVSVDLLQAHWNDEELSNASARLTLSREDHGHHSVGGSTNETSGLSAPVSALSVFPPLDSGFLNVVHELIESLGAD